MHGTWYKQETRPHWARNKNSVYSFYTVQNTEPAQTMLIIL